MDYLGPCRSRLKERCKMGAKESLFHVCELRQRNIGPKDARVLRHHVQIQES